MTATFNPLDPGFIENPYPYYQYLRANAPVVWADAVYAWVVSRHDDILPCLRDPRFQVDAGNTTAFRAMKETTGPTARLAEVFQRQMLFRDPPEHTRLRGLVNKAF